jgi:phosphate transport system substrate-binding protein
MKPTQRFIFIALVTLLFVTGCGQKPSGPVGQGNELKGTIAVSGAFALYPMMIRWTEEFQKVNPGVQFDVSAGGAGKGMSDALAGAVDIGMVSRTITPEEEAKGAYWVSVTRDAVFVIVNEKNPVWEELSSRGITKEKLIGIYITGEITSWGQAVDRPEVTDAIHVFTRSDAAGAPETFAKYLDNKKQEDLLGVGVFGDPGLLDTVVKDPLGIGYNNLGYAYDIQSGNPMAGAKVVPLDVNENGNVDPEEDYATKAMAIEAVKFGHYPSPPARDLNLVMNGKPEGLVKIFIEWVLTDGQKYVDEAGYIQLPADQISAGIEKLQ